MGMSVHGSAFPRGDYQAETEEYKYFLQKMTETGKE